MGVWLSTSGNLMGGRMVGIYSENRRSVAWFAGLFLLFNTLFSVHSGMPLVLPICKLNPLRHPVVKYESCGC